MSNINIQSDMGGGNSLNLIRIPSLNEANNIIFKSDLNGTITPGNSNTWQIKNRIHWWTQNNSNNAAYIIALRDGITNELMYKNDNWNSRWREPYCFLPVIEYRE